MTRGLQFLFFADISSMISVICKSFIYTFVWLFEFQSLYDILQIRPCLIMFDSVDSLSPSNNPQSLSWLPDSLPPNVYWIVTFTSDSEGSVQAAQVSKLPVAFHLSLSLPSSIHPSVPLSVPSSVLPFIPPSVLSFTFLPPPLPRPPISYLLSLIISVSRLSLPLLPLSVSCLSLCVCYTPSGRMI